MPEHKGRDMGNDSTLVRNRKAELAKAKPESDSDRLIGNMLADRYLIMERIGQGGMGTVYLAEDGNLDGKKVAVKVLPKYLARMPNVVSRFVQEAKLAPKIEHENIINVTDRGTTPEGIPFFVMEHLKGADLSETLADWHSGWNMRTADIMLQMCRALSAAHEKGIVHRDLKPENVFLVERSDGSDFIKLFDFGIAKMLEQAQSGAVGEDGEVVPSGPNMTMAGMVLGTPAYMAPEQARGEAIDHRVDVYAMGTMLYEMVCGAVPFDAEDTGDFMERAHKILRMQKEDTPLTPSRRRPDLKIPPELDALVMKALAKDPAERFQSMKEMEGAIAALAEKDVEPAPAPTITSLRFGPRSSIGYLEIQKQEGRRRSSARAKVAAILAAAALAAGLGAYAKGCVTHPDAPAMIEKK